MDWPQVGFSTDNTETYVVWLRFTDGEVDTTAVVSGLEGIETGTGYGDIACSASARAGCLRGMPCAPCAQARAAPNLVFLDSDLIHVLGMRPRRKKLTSL